MKNFEITVLTSTVITIKSVEGKEEAEDLAMDASTSDGETTIQSTKELLSQGDLERSERYADIAI